MTAIHKGFVAAAAIHGVLFTLWLGYELTGKIYRENLRLDFTLVTGTATGGTTTGASEPDGAETDDGQQAEGAAKPANAASTGTANGAGSDAGGGYANQNLASISGVINGRVYYPRIARKNNWQGRVLVHFVVGTDGRAHDVMLRESSGHRVLDESALETIRELDGLPRPPVPVPLTVPVHFKLKA